MPKFTKKCMVKSVTWLAGDVKGTHTFIEKSRARSSRCCGQPSVVGRVGNIGVDINWDASPVSSPATVLIHCGEVNKSQKVKSQ